MAVEQLRPISIKLPNISADYIEHVMCILIYLIAVIIIISPFLAADVENGTNPTATIVTQTTAANGEHNHTLPHFRVRLLVNSRKIVNVGEIIRILHAYVKENCSTVL